MNSHENLSAVFSAPHNKSSEVLTFRNAPALTLNRISSDTDICSSAELHLHNYL